MIKAYKSIIKNKYFANEKKRDQWVKLQLSRIKAGGTILDAGAGEQKYRKYCKHLRYTSQDFCEYEGEGDGTGLQTGKWDTIHTDIVGDICNIDRPDNSFDAILCTEVFEHIPNPVLAIEEFSRLLKEGGVLILTAPFCSLTHFAPYHFYSGFNRYWYEVILKEYGFIIDELESNGNYFMYLIQEVNRLKTIIPKYTSSKRMKLIDRFISMLFLERLMRIESRTKGSDELLCFGYHLVARKTEKII